MATAQIIWFRQDLRLADQAAVAAAAAAGPVVALYVLDDATPGDWRIGRAQRWWLHHSLAALDASLKALGGGLLLRRGRAATVVAQVAAEVGATAVHALRHYEPWAQAQQRDVAGAIELHLHDGLYLALPETVAAKAGGRYRIFTPFWRTLAASLPPPPPRPAPQPAFAPLPASDRLADWRLLPTTPDWATGFAEWTPGEAGAAARLERFLAVARRYDLARNLPSDEGSSRLSPHLHFGEISPATVWHAVSDAAGRSAAEPYLREIGWRDFAAGLIDQFPDYGERPSRAQFERFGFRDDADNLAAWRRGQTGYPIVDAGMRQLWASGWMHNRVRMIAASFLVKHLLIDWRHGARWFWDTLVDADYANNALGWQWVMGSGVDSSPFNRVFAPVSQSAKFDAAGYIRRWVPELARLGDAAIHAPWEAGPLVLGAAGVRLGDTYPPPIVDHAMARARALAAYDAAKAG